MDSYQDPKVRELIGKAKVFFADDPKKVFYFDNMLSGKMKKDYREFIASGPSTPKGLPRGPNTDQGADPLSRRVWPPKSNQTKIANAQSTANSEGAPAGGATDNSDAANRRLFTWLGVAAIILGSGVWLIFRFRKRRRSG
jgi:hypothetical protein